jgi:hypothetical protein
VEEELHDQAEAREELRRRLDAKRAELEAKYQNQLSAK